jgi:protein O-mannosyl-transferase
LKKRNRPVGKPQPVPEKPPAPPISTPWRLKIALVVIALAAYANSFGLGVAFDGNLIRQDSRIQSLTAGNLKTIATTHYWWPVANDRLYRPFTIASFLVNYTVLGSGTNPGGYHAVNFLIHAVNALLAFALAFRILRHAWTAFFAAAIWAVHPIGTEAVANIAGRADLLAGASLLSGLLLYIRIVDSRPRPWLSCAALFVAAFAAVFSKETGAVLIVLMALWDLTFGRGIRWTPPRVAAYAAAIAAVAIWAAGRNAALQAAPWPEMPFVMNPLLGAEFWTARLTALTIVARYLGLLVWPLGLASDRAYNQIPVFHAGHAGGWVALLALAAVAAVLLLRRKDKVLLWSAAWFAILLFPASNLAVLIGSIMADRFVYLPSFGFALVLSAVVFRLAGEQRAPTVLAVVAFLFAARTLVRNPDWNDDMALAAADVQTVPDNFRPHANLASALFERDRKRHLDAAIREEERAWEILRDLPPERMFVPVPADLGMFYGLKGDAAGSPSSPRAVEWYRKAADILGRAREASRIRAKAFQEAQLLHGKQPLKAGEYRRLYSSLGTTFARLGRHGEAIESYRYYRALAPDNQEGFDDVARAYLDSGNQEGAAIIILGKGIAFGFLPRTVSILRDLYGKLPGGECAIRSGAAPAPDPACPRMRNDLCAALGDLQQMYTEAGRPDRVNVYKDMYERRYSCAAPR